MDICDLVLFVINPTTYLTLHTFQVLTTQPKKSHNQYYTKTNNLRSLISLLKKCSSLWLCARDRDIVSEEENDWYNPVFASRALNHLLIFFLTPFITLRGKSKFYLT